MTLIDVAIAGLRFGSSFAKIYAAHPQVGEVGIVDPDENAREGLADELGLRHTYASLDELLAGDRFDAVHVVTPVRFHADHVQAVLRSGRHCMSAVPMATELDDLWALIRAVRASGKRYMMAETAVFAREYLYVKEAYDKGEIGELTFFRGAHLQDLTGYAWYWQGYPPMKYVTHALAPALALSGARVTRVQALGSGRLPVTSRYPDNDHPLQTGLFRLDRGNLAAEITMAFFATAHTFHEGFSVYGTRGSIEWPYDHDGPMLRHSMDPGVSTSSRLVEPPFRPDLLPAELRRFAEGGHGGSHPHLVHEFVSAIVSDRPPLVDEVTAATWTAPGICAHASARAEGAPVDVPDFRPR